MRQGFHTVHRYFDAIILDLGDLLVHLDPAIWVQGLAIAQGDHGEPAGSVQQGKQVEQLKLINQVRLRQSALPAQPVMDPLHELSIWHTYYGNLLGMAKPRFAAERIPAAADYLARATVNPQSFTCFPDVFPALQKWTAAGIKLGLISNAYPSARAILEERNLAPWFDVILLSHEQGVAKPELAIYQRALERLGVGGQRAIFIDDRARYLRLADGSHLPLHALLMDRGYAWLEKGWRGPVIHSLSELDTGAGLRAGLCCPMPADAKVAA